jgi:putative addiction module component (TIGR02574 family)
MRRNPHFDFSHLSAPDRVELALDLWESLEDSEREAAFPMTPELAAELDRRVAEMDADEDPGRPWDEVVSEIRGEARLRQRGA